MDASAQSAALFAAVGSSWTTSVTEPASWALLFLFAIAMARRVFMAAAARLAPPLSRRSALDQGDEMAAQRRLASCFAHLLNFVLSTVALGFQLAAGSALAVPSPNIDVRDVTYLAMTVKLVLIAYVAELLCTDSLHFHICLHHLLTFFLLFFGELSITHSKQAQWVPFCGWLIFQATIEQPCYVAMACNHMSVFLTLRNRAPRWRQRLLRVSAQICRFNVFWSYPQKLLPLIFAFYWLSRLFRPEMDAGGISAFAAVWAALSLSAVVVLDLYFLESNWPITHHICKKAGLAFPARSPWSAFAMRLISRRDSWHEAPEESFEDVSKTSTPNILDKEAFV